MYFKKATFPLLLILIAWFSYFITVHQGGSGPVGYLEIEVAPASSKILLDGHVVKAGRLTVSTGKHSLVVSKKGFSTQSQGVVSETGQTVYAGIVLQPSSTQTADWYSSHPADQKIVEGIGSHQSDYQSGVALRMIPFLKLLPTEYGDGHGGLISISQGVPASKLSTLPAVYVIAQTPGERQGVVTYIKSRGYDVASMDLVFSNMQSPLQPVGGD